MALQTRALKSSLAALAAALVMTGTAWQTARPAEPSAPQYGHWGFDLTGMETADRPGDSFFEFANGAWEAHAEIPADKARYGMFDMLSDDVEAQLRAIIEEAGRNAAGPQAALDTNQGKIGALFNSFMDERRAEELDAAPIAGDLARIPRRRHQA